MVKSAAWIRSNPPEEVAKAIRPFFASLDEAVYLSALTNVREAVIADGRMTAAASDTYQKVLLMTGHLKSPVAFDAVLHQPISAGLTRAYQQSGRHRPWVRSKTRSRRWAYTLPEPFKFPKPNRTGCVVVGSIIFVSGHGRNMTGPGVKAKGKVGRDLTVEEGYATARAVALSMLASLKQELGDLDRVKRVVRLFGMVNVAPGFDRMPRGDRRRVGFLLRAVRPENRPACAHGGRHGRAAARHSGRDQRRVRAEDSHRLPAGRREDIHDLSKTHRCNILCFISCIDHSWTSLPGRIGQTSRTIRLIVPVPLAPALTSWLGSWRNTSASSRRNHGGGEPARRARDDWHGVRVPRSARWQHVADDHEQLAY